MSIEKQIEEMAKDIALNMQITPNPKEKRFHQLARLMYGDGYRKQSEVVRCKDCKHFYQDGNLKVCKHWNCHSTEDNAYCSFAKMKGGAE